MPRTVQHPAQVIQEAAHRLSGGPADYEPLLARAATARLVLLGESTHGTQEFYRERARITRLLIEQLGFSAIGLEADWPDTHRVHRFVTGRGQDTTPEEALRGFRRFPAWMWRNREMAALVGWLKDRNSSLGRNVSPAGIWGLDLYSLHASIEAVLAYLDRSDPDAAARARARYGCFEIFGDDPQAYGYAAGMALSRTCEDEVVSQLRELQQHRHELVQRDGADPAEDYFVAEQNARVIRESERYYRTVFRGQVESWNLRDTHMADTLDAVMAHLGRKDPNPRIVVWAHNSHVGDARATEMGRHGELNLGQLVRARYGDEALIVGFSTYLGTVTAARDWGEPPERRRLRPGFAGSYEELLHQTVLPAFLVDLSDPRAREALGEERSFRAVGVIYRPETERRSHYFRARLQDQFDLLVHWDETEALEPLEPGAEWEKGELPETYPFGV